MPDPVRWGVLGVARFARNQWLPSFLNTPSVEGVAIASRSEGKAREAAAEFGFSRGYGSYEALLEDPDVEAVYIPLPNGLHGEWGIRAARAGKHVMVEKPAANDLNEARSMARAARENGVRLMEAFVFRHHARWKRARALLDEGAIGAPRSAHGVFCFTLEDAGNVRFDPKLAGGALADVGCYPVSAARFVLGAEPTHAFGFARDPGHHGVDTTFSGLLRFPGADVSFYCSFESAFGHSFRVIGSEGTLSLNRPFLCREEPVEIMIAGPRGDEDRVERLPLGDQYVDEIAHFSACVRDAGRALWPGEDGVAQAAVLDALRASTASGQLEPVAAADC